MSMLTYVFDICSSQSEYSFSVKKIIPPYITITGKVKYFAPQSGY